MKNRSLWMTPLAAVAAVILILLSGAPQAQADKKLSFTPRSEEGVMPRRGIVFNKQSAHPPAAPSGYPRYKLIDLGTLGGPESNSILPARGINNRGQMIAFAETDVTDPDCYFGCFVGHAILRLSNGDIVELPFPSDIDPAGNSSFAGDIAANGLLAGFVANGEIDPLTGFPQVRPVVWESGGVGVWNLGTFGGNSGTANMVNRNGAAVGDALNEVPENPDFATTMNGFLPAATQARAFFWDGSELRDLGTLGGNDANAIAINDAGTIFGMSYTDTVANDVTGLPTTHPFLWTNGQMQDLGSLGGTLAVPGSFDPGPFPSRILNERGQAIGTSTLAGDESWHAFLWDHGTMSDLGTLGGELSEALAINQRGWVVGRAEYSLESHSHHAVLWRNGTSKDLGIVAPCENSTATAVNSNGEVVGGLGRCTEDPKDPNYYSGFIWLPGMTMVDLNSLVMPPSDIHIEDAANINDKDEITVQLILPNGEHHSGLLVPLPQ